MAEEKSDDEAAITDNIEETDRLRDEETDFSCDDPEATMRMTTIAEETVRREMPVADIDPERHRPD